MPIDQMLRLNYHIPSSPPNFGGGRTDYMTSKSTATQRDTVLKKRSFYTQSTTQRTPRMQKTSQRNSTKDENFHHQTKIHAKPTSENARKSKNQTRCSHKKKKNENQKRIRKQPHLNKTIIP